MVLAATTTAALAAELAGSEARAVRAWLERAHAGDWSRFELLDIRWTNGAPERVARLGPISGDAKPTPNGTVLLYVEVADGEGATRRLPLTATVRPWIRVPVSVRAFTRGHSIDAADVRVEERLLSELHGATPAAVDGLRLRARRNLMAGEILTTASVEEAPVIRSGSRVTIRFVSGPMRLTALGTARRSGRRGEMIPVENVDSRRTVHAEVVDERTVEVRP